MGEGLVVDTGLGFGILSCFNSSVPFRSFPLAPSFLDRCGSRAHRTLRGLITFFLSFFIV